jgi:hypothetical protein
MSLAVGSGAPIAVIAIACTILAAGPRAQESARKIDTSAKAVAVAAEHYVDGYQKQLSYVIADEAGVQRVTDRFDTAVATRTTKAEVFLTFLKADRVWLSIRDVSEVDGRPLEHREDLRVLLTNSPLRGLAATLADESSRFNIGSIGRNFNDPTLGLLVLDATHRAQFSFDRTHVDETPEGPVVTLAFKERDGPTLIHDTDGRRMFAKGELRIEAGTGRVRQTDFAIETGGIRARLTTTFVNDAHLEMWVPAVLTERYERTDKNRHETIVCESTYSNYRRFDVQVRIK